MGLILTRKEGQHLVLVLPDGRMVTVMVKEIEHHRVHLDCVGPKDVRIFRDEVFAEKVVEMNRRDAE